MFGAILSVMEGLISDGKGGLQRQVWADLCTENSICCYSAEEIRELIPFGRPATPQHQKLAILNHILQKGFNLGSIESHQNSTEIRQTDYYLEIQPNN